jgi:nitronate monooxygenase
MPTQRPDLARAERFCATFGLRVPILLAPMAGACPPSLSTPSRTREAWAPALLC